jgi:hypothetical protein
MIDLGIVILRLMAFHLSDHIFELPMFNASKVELYFVG